jgi:predicted metalloprotease with PDZ domain
MFQKKFAILSLLFIGFELAAAPIKHLIQMPNPQSHYFEVTTTLDVRKESGKFIDLKMAAWTPGSYLIREFARNVEYVQASTTGGSLQTTKVSKNTWRVSFKPGTTEIQVKYKVYAFELSVRTSFLDDVHGYINPASVLLYVAKWAKGPHELQILPHKDFKKVSTALKNTGGLNYVAKDLDELFDSPIEIGNHRVWDFKVNNIPHQIAFFGQTKVDSTKFIADVTKMAQEAQNVVGAHPCDHYLFIIHNIQRGSGGLEHLYSTTCSVSRTAYETPKGYQGVIGLLAHEYFHLWNVKRIRPVALGPFDYENENYTHNLWFAEGVTDYYADVITHRMGLVPADAYIQNLGVEISNVENTPGNHVESAADASWNAWIKYYRQNENSRNSTVSYYEKGSLLGGVLNMWIISQTNGTKSLDDVLTLLYQKYYLKLGRGFTDAELENAFSTVAGTSAASFFKESIYGVKSPDYSNLFGQFGYTITDVNATKSMPFMGFTVVANKITNIYKDGPAFLAGLNVGDEIVQVNQVDFTSLDKLMTDKKVGDMLKFQIKRDGLERNFDLKLDQTMLKSFSIRSVDNPTDAQVKLRRKWLRNY